MLAYCESLLLKRRLRGIEKAVDELKEFDNPKLDY